LKKYIFFCKFFEKHSRKTGTIFNLYFFPIFTEIMNPQITQTAPQRPVVSAGAKRMLSATLAATLSHNQRNLASNARNKNPNKLTDAERSALSSVNPMKN
jgi:hypothetical protein